jgi:hypothetical protein
MRTRYILLFLLALAAGPASAQTISVPELAVKAYPRFFAGNGGREKIKELIATQEWARNACEQARQQVGPYISRCQADSSWMVSRLQMYWKTKSTEVFIKGGVYDHAEGVAPVPTVRFPGARDNVTVYGAPKLEDVLPYMDDPRGVYLVNRSKTGQPMEWAEISKTGRTIESINTQIMQLANTAARLYWIGGEERYARFAFDLFDVYMTGMYYRDAPVDITHGHHQTLAGLSTFEVIREVALLNQLTGIYDCLHGYLQQHAPAKMPLYAAVFKKCADVQIAHGVAYNNWDLMQAKNILNIALVLDDNAVYKDGKGNRYYTNIALNVSSERQWSIVKILEQGYDSTTGLWYESPGYSVGVLGDFVGFVSFFDNYYHLDILPYIPVLQKAVLAVAQYLFPNGYASSFGDSHYGRINTAAAEKLVINAQQNRKPEQEADLTRYIKTINDFNRETGGGAGMSDIGGGRDLTALLLPETRTELSNTIATGKITDYVSAVFSAPNVSYFALRNGFNSQHGLMAAMSGSRGNHMHAGGIAMELYGKGLVLAPESGIGTSYFQPDYAEYYSQFPAHNTVAVDGISAYPVMKSNHGFDVLSAYPASGVTKDCFPAVSFGDLYFLEPETNSDQNRLTSIIRTSDSTGYYVDIFRSKRKDGRDKMHDYFYHNMGQELTLAENSGTGFNLKPTDKLAFAGGYLFAYDYFWDKRSVVTSEDINAIFRLSIPGKEDVLMNMWLKGEQDREIFSVKAPASKAIDRMGLPKEITELPLPTIVARQNGEAWTKPFVAVYEPTTGHQPKSIASIASFTPAGAAGDFTGVHVKNKSGSEQYIFSLPEKGRPVTYNDLVFEGACGVVSEYRGNFEYLFLGNGKTIGKAGFSISSRTGNGYAALRSGREGWFFTSSQPVLLTLPAGLFPGKTGITLLVNNKSVTIAGKKIMVKGKPVMAFELPAVPYTKMTF